MNPTACHELLGEGFDIKIDGWLSRFSVMPVSNPSVVIRGTHKNRGFREQIDLFCGISTLPFASIRCGWRKVEVRTENGGNGYALLTIWGIVLILSPTVARFYDASSRQLGILKRPSIGNQLTAGFPGSSLKLNLMNRYAEAVGEVSIIRGIAGYPSCQYMPKIRSDMNLVTIMATCMVMMRTLTFVGG